MVGYVLGLALVAVATCGYLAAIAIAARRFYRRTQASWNAPKLIWGAFVVAFGLLGLSASLMSIEAVYAITISTDSAYQALASASGGAFATGLVLFPVSVFGVFIWIVSAYFASFRLPPRFRVKHLPRPLTTRQKQLVAASGAVNAIAAGILVGAVIHIWIVGLVVGILMAAIEIAAIVVIARPHEMRR